jgi:hypothetical protein
MLGYFLSPQRLRNGTPQRLRDGAAPRLRDGATPRACRTVEGAEKSGLKIYARCKELKG